MDEHAHDERPAARQPLRALSSLRAHAGVAGLVFLLVAVPGALFGWQRGTPRYVSSAAVQVAPQFMSTLQTDQELRDQTSRYRDFLQQQVLNIVRFEVIEDALHRLGDERAPWQREEETHQQAVERLQEELSVVAQHGSFQITVELEGYEPDGLAEIVNAVVDTYLEVQRTETFFAGDERLAALQEYRVEQQALIEEKVAEKIRLAQDLGISSFDVGAPNPYQTSMVEAGSALEEARRELIAAESELASLDVSKTRLLELELESEARLMVTQDPSLSGLNKSLAERRNTLHAEMIGLTEEHPGYLKAKEEIAEIDGALQLAFDDALGRAREILEQRRVTRVDEERAQASARVERAKLVVDSLAGEVDRLRDRVGWFVTNFELGRALEEEVARHRDRLSDIDNREDLFKVESQSPGFARLQSRARTPDRPTRGGRFKYIVVFLILAAGLATGAALIADRLDPLIHTPDDIERAFGHPPLGWIVERTDERMRGLAEDQLRRLALSLDRERRTRDTKVVAVTSPKPGSGTTTFIEELSQELVAIGMDVLTVDANAYHANQVNGQAGLIDLLERDVDPSVAIVPGLASHLPLGASAGARRLPGPHRLSGLLETVGKDYDLVLVDAPPLLLSSDAELLVGLADATLLLVVAEVDDVVEVRRALTVLGRLTPPVGNLVLNRVRLAKSNGFGRDMVREFETGSRVDSAGTLSRWLRS